MKLFLFVLTFCFIPLAFCQKHISYGVSSPHEALDQFREMMSHWKKTIVQERDIHQEIAQIHEDMNSSVVNKIQDFLNMLGDNIELAFDTSMMMDKITESSRDLVNYAKRLNNYYSKRNTIHEAFYNGLDSILKDLRDRMVMFKAEREQLPPFLSEIFGLHYIVSGKEKASYDKAIEHIKNENWQEAYISLNVAWKELNKTINSNMKPGVPEHLILDSLHQCFYKMGRLLEAIQICDIGMSRPGWSTFLQNKFYHFASFYKQELVSEPFEKFGEKFNELPIDDRIEMAVALENTAQYRRCQSTSTEGESLKKISFDPKYYCRYDNRNWHPLLILSPVKEEILHFDPVVVVWHGLIGRQDIENLKNVELDAKATVIDDDGGPSKLEYQNRNADVAWVRNEDVQYLTRKIEAHSGLNPRINAAERYQIGRYRIGGHFVPHFDTITQHKDRKDPMRGDRIATLLMYMSEVEQGGATVFPQLNLKYTPEVGSALFWFNMNKNETIDFRTMHAGCPVVRGEKWIINKWFRYRGQLLYKKCPLVQLDSFTIEDFTLSKHVQSLTFE